MIAYVVAAVCFLVGMRCIVCINVGSSRHGSKHDRFCRSIAYFRIIVSCSMILQTFRTEYIPKNSKKKASVIFRSLLLLFMLK